jgi:hypothetical protein
MLDPIFSHGALITAFVPGHRFVEAKGVPHLRGWAPSVQPR